MVGVCCQGNTGREQVLFLRLYLLQSLLSYIEGNDAQARQQLTKVSFCRRITCLFERNTL